jgi:hypothetical protein
LADLGGILEWRRRLQVTFSAGFANAINGIYLLIFLSFSLS